MLVISSFATIILAFLLIFFNRKTNSSSIYLFLMLLFVSVHGVLQSSIIYKGPVEVIMIFFNNFSPLYFLIGPMLYFYVRNTLTDYAAFSKKDIWHFVPSAIVLINVVPYWFTSPTTKHQVAIDLMNNINTVRSFDDNWLIPSSVNFVARGLQMLFYVLACIQLLLRHIPKKSKNALIPKDQEKITYSWLVILVSCMLIAILGYYISSLILVFAEHPEKEIWHSLFIAFNYICFIPLLIIPLALLTFPQILYGIPLIHHSSKINYLAEKSYSVKNEILKIPVNDLIDSKQNFIPNKEIEDELKESAQAIMDYMVQEKPYLDKDFSMDSLAQALRLPRHHVYFCMNRVLKIKFPDLRKQLRIQHARQLLDEGKNKVLSIEGIGIQSGFSSRSNFFTAFKNEVGCTPSEYIDKSSSKA